MLIPKYQDIMLPLLRGAADGQVHRLADLIEKLAVEFNLSPAERATVASPGRRRRLFDHRVWWARTDLVQAGVLETSERGTVRVTERGLELLREAPARIDRPLLSRYSEFRAFLARSRPAAPSGREPATTGEPEVLPGLQAVPAPGSPSLPSASSEEQARPRATQAEGDDEPGHTKAQWQLAQIGKALGLDVWIPRPDRHKAYRGERLGDLSVGTLPALGLPQQVQGIIENIDVLWIDAGVVVCAFEIEHSTTVYSGLLRLSDLVTVQPYTTIRLFIVAASDRRDKVGRELARPTFARTRPPLSQLCRFLTYEHLGDHLRFAQQHGRYLRFDWVDSLGERTGIPGPT